VRGCSAQEATAAAIAEFGDPRMVAAGFGPELAAAQARRVALGLVATGPLVGTAWIVAVTVNALAPWRQQLSGPWLALPLVGLALAPQSARRAASSLPGHPGHPPPDPRARPARGAAGS
jgi:hypothetical protein